MGTTIRPATTLELEEFIKEREKKKTHKLIQEYIEKQKNNGASLYDVRDSIQRGLAKEVRKRYRPFHYMAVVLEGLCAKSLIFNPSYSGSGVTAGVILGVILHLVGKDIRKEHSEIRGPLGNLSSDKGTLSPESIVSASMPCFKALGMGMTKVCKFLKKILPQRQR